MDFKNKSKDKKVNLFYPDLNSAIDTEKEKDFWEMFFCLYFLSQKKEKIVKKKIDKIIEDYNTFLKVCIQMQKEGKTLQDVFNFLPNNKWVKIKKEIIYKLILKKIPSNNLH